MILLKTGKDKIGDKISVAYKAILVYGNHFLNRFLFAQISEINIMVSVAVKLSSIMYPRHQSNSINLTDTFYLLEHRQKFKNIIREGFQFRLIDVLVL